MKIRMGTQPLEVLEKKAQVEKKRPPIRPHGAGKKVTFKKKKMAGNVWARLSREQ